MTFAADNRVSLTRQAVGACIGLSDVSNTATSAGAGLVSNQPMHVECHFRREALLDPPPSDRLRPLQDITTETVNHHRQEGQPFPTQNNGASRANYCEHIHVQCFLHIN